MAVLTAAALATAALTATVGLGGGIVLLTVMLLYLEPLVAIPLHAVIQLVSNSSRTYIQRRHVRWRILWYYALPLVPLGYVGLAFARSLTPQQLKVGIGLFVLLATWVPRACPPESLAASTSLAATRRFGTTRNRRGIPHGTSSGSGRWSGSST